MNSAPLAPARAAPPQNRAIAVRGLGRQRYAEVWALQRELLEATVARKTANRDLPAEARLPTENHLLFVEHEPVYTLGKSGRPEHLLLTPEALAAQGIDYFPIDRGGDITYHGPGQIVGYPIWDLENFFTDIARYLRGLEEAIILTVNDYGLPAGRIAGLTGVWLGGAIGPGPERKIAALGVKCARWVAMHGFAFNVNTDLAAFARIVPCGIADKAVTSLAAELGRLLPLAEVQAGLLGHLLAVFDAHEA